jgi:hypothetical protein
MTEPSQVAIYSRGENGHRGQYIAFVTELLNAERISERQIFGCRKAVFYLMVEDSFALYVLGSLWRAMFGRQTVGLLFRPTAALTGTALRHKIKRWTLQVLKLIPCVKTLTIIPFSVAPEFARIADGWIYDLQLWDLDERDYLQVSRLREVDKGEPGVAIGQSRRGRQVVTAIGTQDYNKGFDTFAKAWTESSELQAEYLFAFGGKVAPALKLVRDEFERFGGVAVDRRISDEELMSLYAAADAIWCLYSADYDQASGIFGRAVQLGVPALVREGSFSHKLCLAEDIPHIASTDVNVTERLAESLPRGDQARGRSLSTQFRARSVATLKEMLKLGKPSYGR